MEVKTKVNGIVNVEEKQLVTFPEGLLGFEKYTKFALIDSEYEPFIWLQSTEESNLAFLMIDPFLICNDYEADIDDSTLKNIGVESAEDIIIMTLVTIPKDGSAITANFLGPIVINKKNRKCLQVILNDNRWTTKFDIVKALKKKGE
ncbi:MAG: flagellar assembly protein FliW [Treponema sp.]|jgi:flagellar assembly factor FliW|nr:flagellar assembly protein FliW [Treponema sp.]